MWASAGGLSTGRLPEQAMASGFLRFLTSEQVSLNVVTIDFDTENTSTVNIARIISQKALQQIDKAVSTENEYCVSEGQIHTSRLVSNDTINEMYTLDETDIRKKPFDPEQHIIGELRSGKVMFEDDHRAETTIDPEAVEVKVSFTGLNKEDVLIISGSDYPTTFSHEIGGIVQRVGSAVKHFAVGHRVVGFSFDKFATIQRVREDLLQGVEDNESLSEMASLPMGYGAALHGLKTLANLQAGATGLILHGSGLAGAAAIKLAQALGGHPYVMVDAETHVNAVMSHFGLNRNQVLLESELVQLVQANGQLKVDVIFSSGWVNASTAREAWRNIAPFGHFVDCGRKNVLSRSVFDTIPIHRGANYLAFDMLDLYSWQPDILSGLLASTVSLYRQNLICALRPFSVKNMTELNSCVASFSDTFEAGKTIVTHDVSDGLLDMLPTRPTLSVSSDATYLLVGCLGGLGRSLTSWMMKKGARKFAFLSRSGADSVQASNLVEAVEAAGANVQVIRGDASVRSDVDRAVRDVPSDRPNRGIIQAAMVLKDGLFHNMPYENWIDSTKPKVQGTMNLHAVLEGVPLDFFVMTSSVSGTLGTPDQSNYAAANSYLDSLARHRRSLQKPAVSVILPMVLGVGVVAENLELEDALKRKGMYGIDEEHLLGAFEVAIIEQQRLGTTDHIVVGLDPAQLHKAISEAGEDVDSFWTEDPRFKTIVHAMQSESSDASGAGASRTILSTIKGDDISPAEAIQAVKEHFIAKLARSLMLAVKIFEEDGKSVASYGIDSMIGAELRTWIFKELAIDIPFQQLLGPSLTVTKFAEQVCANQGISEHNE